MAAMEEHGVEAIIFPTWNNPPRKIGDMESPDGNNSYQVSPPTGMPAITVPMGFAPGNLPAGLQITARMFEEATLFRLAYAYEQGTKHRSPIPPLPPIAAAEYTRPAPAALEWPAIFALWKGRGNTP